MLIARMALLFVFAVTATGFSQTNAKAAKNQPDPQATAANIATVQVRAVVSDRAGKLIEGLAKEDFVLMEDEASVPLDAFSVEKIDEKSALQPTSQKDAAPVSSRVIVLLVDTAHISPNGLERVRIALGNFVGEQTGAQDVIAVMTSTGKPGVKGEFTTDRAKLKAAIKSIRPGFTEFESFLTPVLCGKVVRRDPEALGLTTLIIDSEDRTAGSMQMPSRTNPEAEAVSRCRMLLLETASRRKSVTSTIEAAIQRLSAMPGQPLIALFTEGFSMIASGGEVATSDVRPATSSAARSGVMIYAFDAKVPMSSKQVNIESYSLASEILNSTRDQQQGMSLLAGETGGGAFFNLDGLVDQLKQMLDDNRVCYRLTYSPPSGKDPRKYRSISISVKGHPEYRVRTQKGYDLANTR